MQEHGEKISLSNTGGSLEKRVRPLAESIQCDFWVQSDVSSNKEMNTLFEKTPSELESSDILDQPIAYANRENIVGRYINTSRDGFHLTTDISVYSLMSLMKPGSSIVASRTIGEVLFVDSGYNILGLTIPEDLQVPTE